jgi:hypothetical protein
VEKAMKGKGALMEGERILVQKGASPSIEGADGREAAVKNLERALTCPSKEGTVGYKVFSPPNSRVPSLDGIADQERFRIPTEAANDYLCSTSLKLPEFFLFSPSLAALINGHR